MKKKQKKKHSLKNYFQRWKVLSQNPQKSMKRYTDSCGLLEHIFHALLVSAEPTLPDQLQWHTNRQECFFKLYGHFIIKHSYL